MKDLWKPNIYLIKLKSIYDVDTSIKTLIFIENLNKMTFSISASSEVYSLGDEPIEVLGFKSEKDLDIALLALMETIEPEDWMAA